MALPQTAGGGREGKGKGMESEREGEGPRGRMGKEEDRSLRHCHWGDRRPCITERHLLAEAINTSAKTLDARSGVKKIVVSGNPTDPSFYPPTLKILWTYLC